MDRVALLLCLAAALATAALARRGMQARGLPAMPAAPRGPGKQHRRG